MLFQSIRESRDRLLRVVQRLNERSLKQLAKQAGQVVPAWTDPKTLADLDKVRAETRKTYASMVGPSLVALGIAVVFLYAFFVSHSFPSGVSVGDALFFIIIAMGYVLCSAAMTSLGFMLFSAWVSRLAPKRGPYHFPGGKMARVGSTLESQNSVLVLVAVAAQLLFAVTAGILLRWRFSFPSLSLSTIEVIGLAVACCILAVVTCTLAAILQAKRVASFHSLIASGVGPACIALMWASMLALLFAIFPFVKIAVLAGSITLGGFSLALAVDLLDAPHAVGQPSRVSRFLTVTALCFIAFISPSVAGGVGKEAANFVMKQLGFYAEHATVVVNNTNLVALQSASMGSGQPLYACRIDKEWTSISDVQVWWYGIGTKTYVALPTSLKGNMNTGSSVGLESSGVKLTDQSRGLCVETQTGVYFESNDDILSHTALAQRTTEDLFYRVYRHAGPICTAGDTSDRGTVLITGHADPMPRKSGNNIDLGLQRACKTYLYLRDNLQLLTNKKAMISDAGVVATDDQCPQSAGRLTRIACEESARRVDIKVFTGSSDVQITGAIDANSLCPSILPEKADNKFKQFP